MNVLLRIYLLFSLLSALPLYAAERFYELTIDYQTVNITGQTVEAMLVNGQLPAPILEFNEGDEAVITVHNAMDVDTSIHWHGLLVPPEQDGVPYLSYFPIKPGESFTYRFPVKHAGTYWYHSHTNIQEQRGLHGAIVIRPEKPEPVSYDHEAVLVLEDWTNENPAQVLANLKKDGDWYALKKGSVISLWGYLQNKTLGNWWNSRWTRMGGMDISDVGYDAFLINGLSQQRILEHAKPGERVRLRVINSGASSYFWLQTGEGNMEVIQADGLNVQPVSVEEILIASAETYDLIVTIPERGALEFRSTSQDITGHARVVIGSGEALAVTEKEKPNPYRVDHSQHTTMSSDKHHTHHHGHHSETEQPKKLAYSLLKAVEATVYKGFDREVRLEVTGSMETYNWTFNNTPLSKADKIKIKRGEVVRFTFVNQTMMHHPLHLHGHFFKVISGNGDYDVMKHTVDVGPLQTVSIEFFANEEKDWFFHCHNLYHAKTGMARVIRYDDYEGNPEFDKAKMNSDDIMDDDWYYRGELFVLDDFAGLDLRYGNADHAFEAEVERSAWSDNEYQGTYLYRVDRWTEGFIALFKEDEHDRQLRLGVRYVLPLLIDAEVWVDNDGDLDAMLETEIQLSKRIKATLEADTDDEWFVGLEYRVSEHWSAQWQYRDDVHSVVGVKLYF